MRSPLVREILMDLGNNINFEFLEIRPGSCSLYFSSLRLSPENRPENSFESTVQSLAKKVLKLAQTAQVELGNIPSIPPSTFSYRFNFYSGKWVSVLVASAILGFYFSVVAIAFASSRLIYPIAGVFSLGIFNLLAALGMVALLRAWIRNLQLPSKTFFTVFYSLFILFVLGGVLGELLINRHLDRNPPLRLSRIITDKWMTRGKNSNSYYFRVNCPEIPHPFGLPDSCEIGVRSQAYGSIIPGRSVAEIVIYPGRLHLSWYSDYRVRY